MPNTDQPQTGEFPKFAITVDGRTSAMPLAQAAGAYASLYSNVSIAGSVYEADGTIRHITIEERQKIVQLADQIDASK
jgi:hypothetical protein